MSFPCFLRVHARVDGMASPRLNRPKRPGRMHPRQEEEKRLRLGQCLRSVVLTGNGSGGREWWDQRAVTPSDLLPARPKAPNSLFLWPTHPPSATRTIPHLPPRSHPRSLAKAQPWRHLLRPSPAGLVFSPPASFLFATRRSTVRRLRRDPPMRAMLNPRALESPLLRRRGHGPRTTR